MTHPLNSFSFTTETTELYRKYTFTPSAVSLVLHSNLHSYPVFLKTLILHHAQCTYTPFTDFNRTLNTYYLLYTIEKTGSFYKMFTLVVSVTYGRGRSVRFVQISIKVLKNSSSLSQSRRSFFFSARAGTAKRVSQIGDGIVSTSATRFKKRTLMPVLSSTFHRAPFSLLQLNFPFVLCNRHCKLTRHVSFEKCQNSPLRPPRAISLRFYLHNMTLLQLPQDTFTYSWIELDVTSQESHIL